MQQLWDFEWDVQLLSKELQLFDTEKLDAKDILSSLASIFSLPKTLDALNQKFTSLEKSAGKLVAKYDLDSETWLGSLDGKPALKKAHNAYEQAMLNLQDKLATTSIFGWALAVCGMIAYELTTANTQFLKDLRAAY